MEEGSTSGRKEDKAWKLINVPSGGQPWKEKEGRCNYCTNKVIHHKKASRVINHMKKCASLQQYCTAHAIKLESLVGDNGISVQSNLEENDEPVGEDELLDTVSLYFYLTGTPFTHVDEKHFQNLLKKLCPNICINRHKLSGELLDMQYMKLKSRENEIVQSPGTLTTDGWTDIDGNPIFTFIYANRTTDFFLKSICTEVNSHTGCYIANEISKCIEQHPTIAGCVTDNTSANKKAWELLGSKYPEKFFYGCVSHTLNLLVKNLFGKDEENGVAGVDFPEDMTDNPRIAFRGIQKFIDDCKNVAVYFKKNVADAQNLKHIYALRDDDHTPLIKLQLPGATRWGSFRACLLSIKKDMSLLLGLVAEPIFTNNPTHTPSQKEKRKEMKELLINDNFLPTLNKCLAILEPIDILLQKYQSNEIPLSEIMYDLTIKLPGKYDELVRKSVITLNEARWVNVLVEARWKFVRSRAHQVAYILDPRFVHKQATDPALKSIVSGIIDTELSSLPLPGLPTLPATGSLMHDAAQFISKYDSFCTYISTSSTFLTQVLIIIFYYFNCVCSY